MDSSYDGESLTRSQHIIAVISLSTLCVGLDYILDSRGMFSLGAGTFGLLCGIILTDRLNIDPNTNKNWTNLILPLAIILLGFGLDINMVLSNQIGVAGLYTITITIIAAFSCTLLISRILGIDRLEAFALGAGGAICGNSAVLAVAPSLRLSSKQTGSILAVINILGLATFLSVPLLASAIGFEPESAGIWAGSTVHAVPQAIAAGEAMGGDALSLASGTKLTRVLGLLIVVPAAIIYSSENGESGNKNSSGISRIPLFLPGFILASILSSFLLPETIAQNIEHLGSLLMVPILILIGLSIRPKELLNVSKPIMIAGSVSTVCMMLASAIALVILM